MAENKGDYAHNRATSPTSQFNARNFEIEMRVGAVNTATLVKVTKIKSKGEVATVGAISAQPLVQMVNGINETEDHAPIHNLPYVRMASGKKGIIMDPSEGDIGLVVCADRDTSSVKKSKKVGPPGSGRKHNLADGVYVGTCLSKEAPECYIRFTDDNKIIISPDNGSTVLTVEKDKTTVDVGGMKVIVSKTRIDLGQENAPNAVMTDAGPSSVVFAKV